MPIFLAILAEVGCSMIRLPVHYWATKEKNKTMHTHLKTNEKVLPFGILDWEMKQESPEIIHTEKTCGVHAKKRIKAEI